jgi:transcriptional regulator with XRE-family HTH domain
MSDFIDNISQKLAQNIIYLRKLRGLSQDQLAKLSGVPRTTISYIESGSGNPTLSNLVKISGTLQVSIEELMSDSKHEVKLYRGRDLISLKKGSGPLVLIKKLLPDKISGLEIEHLDFEPGAKFKGSPHVSNTKEYLYCQAGEVFLFIEQEKFHLTTGDLIAFRGDVKHSYENGSNTEKAQCFSVVSFVPLNI